MGEVIQSRVSRDLIPPTATAHCHLLPVSGVPTGNQCQLAVPIQRRPVHGPSPGSRQLTSRVRPPRTDYCQSAMAVAPRHRAATLTTSIRAHCFSQHGSEPYEKHFREARGEQSPRGRDARSRPGRPVGVASELITTCGDAHSSRRLLAFNCRQPRRHEQTEGHDERHRL